MTRIKTLAILFFLLIIQGNFELHANKKPDEKQIKTQKLSNKKNIKTQTITKTNIDSKPKTLPSVLQNYQQDKELVESNYALTKKGLWKQAIKHSNSQNMKNFFEMLDYSKMKDKKDMYDDFLIYQFLSQKYPSIQNPKIEASVKKARAYSTSESITDYAPSPTKLLSQHSKDPTVIKQPSFQKKVKEAWHTRKFISSTEERHFLGTFASILTKEDHNIRLEELLWSGDATSAQRILHKVDNATKLKAKRRLDIQSSLSVDELFKKLNKFTQTEHSNQILLFDAINWCKQRKMHEEIFKLLELIPLKNRVQNNQWWELLKPEIRELISSNNLTHHKLAYKIASNHSLSNTKIEYVEAEFLAGFIAFNFLKDYETAAKHFSNSQNFAKQDFRQSRAAYWLGASYEKINHSSTKHKNKTGEKNYESLYKHAYSNGSKHFATFYGQLCLHKTGNLNGIKNKLVHVSENDIQHTISNPLFSYYYYGLLTNNTNLVKKIAKILTLTAKSKNEIAVLAGIANHLQMPNISLYIGNIALYNMNFLVLEALYPTPNYKHMKFHKALNLSVIRRESNFESGTINDAGTRGKANGLMQIIPAAGIDIAKTIGVEYDHQALLNPQTNVLFGNTFLNHLNTKFNNSIILTAAAYNGGSGSVNKWIKKIGDINDGKNFNSLESKISWIEQTPFRETRYYMQSIISSMVMYNAILHPEKDLDEFLRNIN